MVSVLGLVAAGVVVAGVVVAVGEAEVAPAPGGEVLLGTGTEVVGKVTRSPPLVQLVAPTRTSSIDQAHLLIPHSYALPSRDACDIAAGP
jgi:hypothetical protein